MRAERRTRTIDAFIDLVLETKAPPRPEEVAERADVSIASLYRYFDNLDQLRRDALVRLVERYPDLVTVPKIGTGTRQQRIASFTSGRVELHETLHPLQLLTRADPSASALVDTARQTMADQIRLHFDTELQALSRSERDDTVAAIASVTSVESWEQFRRSFGLSPTQTRRAWSRAVDQLLPRE